MENNKIKKVVRKILLENKPKNYCYEKCNGEITLTVDYKNSRIHINHYPIYEIKEIKSWFCNKREEKIKTDSYCTHVHIYPNDSNIENLYFKFEGNEIGEWLKKYIERYNDNETNKKDKFLKSL